ncbi:MAG: cell division topological specificity factor MinE [Solirubrobacterales bacterium]
MNIFKLFSSKPSSKDMAKERLKLILIHDRANVSPELLNQIKEEILQVLSKYVEIDNGEIEVKMTKLDEDEGNSPALIASIPIRNLK